MVSLLFLTVILLFLSLIFLIAWINNKYSKKINEKILLSFSIIERFQYNSPIFFAIKVAEKNNIPYNEINNWISKYINLLGYNFQKLILNSINFNKNFKFFLIKSICLKKINKKLNKLIIEIETLNNQIREKIKIKELEDNYKVNLSKITEKIENNLEDVFILHPSLKDNENIKNLTEKINFNIKIVDEKIDEGDFFDSAKILSDINKDLNILFNVNNLHPQILDWININIKQNIISIQNLKVFKKNEEKFDLYKKEIKNFMEKCNNYKDIIYNNLFELNYTDSLKILNEWINELTIFSFEKDQIYQIKSKYLSDSSFIWKNITDLSKNLENLIINSISYLGDTETLNKDERLIFKKARKIFDTWNLEINNFIQQRNDSFSLKEYIFLLKKLNNLIKNSINYSEHIKNLNVIYNNHKKIIDELKEKIFSYKNKLNNLQRWLKKINNNEYKNNFMNYINKFFTQLEEIKIKNLYPSNLYKIEVINEILKNLDYEINKLEKDIKIVILFDKLTEELIVYNNKFLIKYPEISEILTNSKKAYIENDIDLSFRLSLSILNSVNENHFKR